VKKSDIVFIAVATLLWLTVVLGLAFVVPVFQEMFMDSGSPLPSPTNLCFQLSALIRSSLRTYFSVSIVVLLSCVVVTVRRDRRSRMLFFWSGILVFLVFATVLFLPILDMALAPKLER
jgi:type II secretory pathway component PulF